MAKSGTEHGMEGDNSGATSGDDSVRGQSDNASAGEPRVCEQSERICT